MEYKIKKLNIRDRKKIRDLENSSYESYYVKARDSHLDFILKDGISYGVFVGNKLVAFSDAFFLNEWEHQNWIHEIFIENGQNTSDKTIVFGSTFVHKKYRGNGFQKTLREKMIKKYKGYKFVSRIAQKNKYSIKNIRSLGFRKLCSERIMGTNISLYFLNSLT